MVGVSGRFGGDGGFVGWWWWGGDGGVVVGWLVMGRSGQMVVVAGMIVVGPWLPEVVGTTEMSPHGPTGLRAHGRWCETQGGCGGQTLPPKPRIQDLAQVWQSRLKQLHAPRHLVYAGTCRQ